ncbi:MAG TPA: hypothetical protein VGP99_08355 [Tepidisphaeraceae bacterium]|jgi:hypothetical protein|nr:hypothetical protein [Tepidisphaeraceae bacterium]
MPSPKSGTSREPDCPEEPPETETAESAEAGEQTETEDRELELEEEELEGAEVGDLEVEEPESAEEEQAEEEEEEEEEVPEPTITVRWSKQRVTPNHNNAFPPVTPPTDVVPDEALVQMIVETTNVPDGTEAVIEIRHAISDAHVDDGSYDELEVQGNRVVDPDTGEAPEWWFDDEGVYETWNKPFFYFRCTLNYRGLQAETPRAEAQALRVLYWHLCISDAIADSPGGGGLTTQPEMREIAGIMGRVANTRVLQQVFNQRNVPVNLWGSVIRNTYAYHQASHGDVVDRTTAAQLNDGNNNPPTVAVGNWRSVIVLGNTNLGDAEISNTSNCPSVPRYLIYMDTCVAGWEPSFANAALNRGTRNFLAFRCYIPDGDARQMARDFYNAWCGTHQCDPTKIPDVFFRVGAPYYSSMRPILYGAGGGAIQEPPSLIERVLTAIGDAIVGVVNAIASLF